MCEEGNLFAEGAVSVVVQPVELVRFTQKRVEGFRRAMDGGGVRRDGEGSHQTHLLKRTLAASRFIQQLAVLQILRQSLQHGEGLVKVHLEQRKKVEESVRDAVSCGDIQ